MATKVSVVGLGFFGQYLLNILRETPDVDVVAVYDRNPLRVQEIDLQRAKFYSDLHEMYDRERMDATIIAEIPSNHLAPTQLAARKGIHVFCEKPMAASLADCDAMMDVCAKHHVKLMIGFKHRFAKSTVSVKRDLDKFGQPLWAMYTYPLWKVADPGWKFDENGTKGIIVENMVHAFDVLRYLFGEIRSLYAEGANFVFTDVTPPDSAIMVMRFENGAIGGVGGGCTSDQRISAEYLDMHFKKGIAQISGRLDQPFKLRTLLREDALPEDHYYDGSDGIREEIRHFLQCIREDREPVATGLDGRKALEIALAAIESIRKHCVVHL